MKNLRNFKQRSITESMEDVNNIIDPNLADYVDEFWEFVESANWQSDHNYERIRDMIDSEEKRNIYQSINSYFTGLLYNRFKDNWLNKDGKGGYQISDDSYSDLINEVVGRGKEFYDNITPDKMHEMALNHDFTESFAYSFLS